MQDTIIQYGFAGLCVILLGMLSAIGIAFFWMVKKLISLLEESNRVIANNSTVIEKFTSGWDVMKLRLDDIWKKVNG